MRKLRFLIVSASALGAPALAPASALAMPSCAQLATDPANGFAGNPDVSEVTFSLVPTGTGAGCELNFTISPRGGPEHGFGECAKGLIRLRIRPPRNRRQRCNGGSVGGCWKSKVANPRRGGLGGNVGSVTTATSNGYVGSSTDSGHTSAENPG